MSIIINLSQSLVDTISNVLDLSNMAAWNSLQDTNPSKGSELLLQNAEYLGLYLATTLNIAGTNNEVTMSRDNIGIMHSKFYFF